MNIKDTFIKNLCTYAKINTGSNSQSTTIPTTECQFELAHHLQNQLHNMGLVSEVDEHSFLYCLINPGKTKRMCLLAHLDTSEDAPNQNVKPLIHEYSGNDIRLQNGVILRAEDLESEHIKQGDTLVTSDGTTLLGGDDKAGISIIMTLIQFLQENKQLYDVLPEIMVCFSPDEENQKGYPYFNLNKLQKDENTLALTIDGNNDYKVCLKSIAARNFTVRVNGYSIHPGYAYQKMINTATISSNIIQQLRTQLMSAEESKGDDGYLLVRTIKADIQQSEFSGFIRGFTDEQMEYFTEGLHKICQTYKGEATVDIKITHEYENIERYIPDIYKDKLKEVGKKYGCKYLPARGGTDGTRLSILGLPTPDLWYGCHGYHSVKEVINVTESIACFNFVLDFLKLM